MLIVPTSRQNLNDHLRALAQHTDEELINFVRKNTTMHVVTNKAMVDKKVGMKGEFGIVNCVAWLENVIGHVTRNNLIEVSERIAQKIVQTIKEHK